MPKKRTLFVIFITLILVGFAARGPLSVTFFEWYLKGYCRTCLGSRLTYENLRQENDKWVFDHPVLTTKTRLEEGGYRFQADRAVLNVSISWPKRSLNLSVNVENPQLDIGKEAKELWALLEQPPQTFHMFEVHTKFHVPQGTIFVHDFAEDHLIPIPLFFHVKLACKESKKGCAALWFGEKKSDHGFLATFSENEEKEQQVHLDIKHVDCCSLQQIFRGLWPAFKSLEITQGYASGNVVLTFPENSPGYAKGETVVKELSVLYPEMDLEVALSTVELNLVPKEIDGGLKEFQTVGNLSVRSSDIVLKNRDEPFWTVEGVFGSAAFNKDDFANFSFSGVVRDHGKRRHLSAKGLGRFAQEGQASYSIDLHLKGEDADYDTDFYFSARELSDNWSFGEVELMGFGVDELDLAQHLLAKNYPQWKHVHIHDGNINAAMLVYLKGFRLSEVNVERISAHNTSFSYDPWNLNAGVEGAFGSLSFDLSKDEPVKTLNANLKIRQGKLNLEGLDNASSWQLSDIDTNLSVRQGIIQKSLLKGTVAGLKGEIILDDTSASPLILCDFRGDVKEFSQAMPEPVRKGLEKEFGDDTLRITANARKTDDGLVFNGKVSIETENPTDEEIRFGFTMDRSSQHLGKRGSPPPFAMEYYLKNSVEAIKEMTPALAMPLYTAYHQLVSRDLLIVGINLKDGWFKAEKLPLDKYISPFLFRNDQMKLGGLGEFAGRFDEQKIYVNYDVQDMILENSDFSIEIKSLSGENPPANKLVATYMLDFDKGTSYNAFPIRNATYFEKNSGLLYTEINAALSMDDTSAHFDKLTAFCNGLYFSGSADVDWGMPGEGVFEIDMYAHEMHGKVSQLQHLLSHLNKTMTFLKIPVEGNVGLRANGSRLHFSFFKGGYDVESIVQGNLTDGKVTGQNADLSLQELSLNFDYDHKGNTLEFSDIQGTLLVGKFNHVEEYSVSGNGVKFTDYSRDKAEFDVWVGDKTRDIIRLTGKTRQEISENGTLYVNFLFNKAVSHFGDVHPEIIKFGLKDWSQLELFHLTFGFQLKTLLADLQRFSRTGLFFLSRGFLKELNEIENAAGTITADLNFDSIRSMLNFVVTGQELSFGRRHFNKFYLSGNKKDSLWSVEQMKLDEVSLAFDILKEGPLWNINFLGARLGNYLLLGMEGQYSEEDSQLEARINLLEADLARLGDVPLLNPSFDPQLITGKIKATGKLHAALDKNIPDGLHFKLNLNGALNQAKVKDIYLDDIKNMSLSYDTSKGIFLSNINTGIKSKENVIKAGLHLQEVGYDFSTHELLIDPLYFDIPANNITWVMDLLKESFPDKITDPVVSVICSAKDNGSLNGSLRLSSSDTYNSLRIRLSDGRYRFMGSDHNLKGLVIDYDPYSLKMNAEYLHQQQILRLDAHTEAANFDSGEITVSNVSGGHIPAKNLSIFWKLHPQGGFYIQKMSGFLSGMTFDMIRDPDKPINSSAVNLVGQLDINFPEASVLLTPELVSKVAAMEFGKGYSLKGEWSILKTKDISLADSIFFHGELKGNDFEFYGYRFNNLSALLNYSPQAAQIHSLMITDPCGSIQVDHMDFFHLGNGFWQAFIPSLNVREFRPSLLKATRTQPPRAEKTLVIRSIDINNLTGMLGDKYSFTGTGQLTFANPPKKNLQHTILAIPAELLTRIGLDLAVLTPVRGSVLFDIKNGKAALNRFKDVYSKGRLSKFYLANNGIGSYVDFDGNLNLQVRMKQYNLIFKLAELFTVNVQGTLRKPTYALQNQPRPEESASVK